MRRYGWWGLLVWACLGLGLEAAHGFKLPFFLDDELTHLLLRLGHAHGVGLSLLMLVHSSAGVPLLSKRADSGRPVGSALMIAAICLPGGFVLGSIDHPEGDPAVAILLAPIGRIALIWALLQLALAASRRR